MGMKDSLWHKFLINNERYADMINAFGLEGAQIITASDIMEADSKAGTKIRDEVRRVAFGVNFAIIGIESQESIDYSLAVRIMNYDAVKYDEICRHIRDKNMKTRAWKQKLPWNRNRGEYLYHFGREDRIPPVVTFVIYCGKEPWDGALGIRELIDTTDIPKELLKYVPDYKINVIDIRRESDKLSALTTDVKGVLEFIALSDDKERLRELTANNEYYKHMSEDAFELTEEYAHIDGMQCKPNEKGEYDMCQAIEDMRNDSKNEGIAIGKIEGKILAYFDTGMPIDNIASKTQLTVDFVKDTLKANGVLK